MLRASCLTCKMQSSGYETSTKIVPLLFPHCMVACYCMSDSRSRPCRPIYTTDRLSTALQTQSCARECLLHFVHLCPTYGVEASIAMQSTDSRVDLMLRLCQYHATRWAVLLGFASASSQKTAEQAVCQYPCSGLFNDVLKSISCGRVPSW
jgi:hypothetical protein